MNRTPDGPVADPPLPENSDTADPDSVPSPRSGLAPLPRRVRGASMPAANRRTDKEPVDAETLDRLLTGLRDI